MKKIISLLVVLAMLMTMAPAVFAAETAPVEVTIPEANEIGAAMDHNTYTTEMYLVTGTVTEVVNTTYGNLYIKDAEGNQLYIYGLYDIDGRVRYDAMETKPAVGDTITVLGGLGQYNGTVQMKNARLYELNGEIFEETETAPDPEPDTTLTIAEAIALGVSKAHNAYTEGKYYVTGVVTEVYNTEYGNMYIQDAEGNTLTVYGTYDADGTNRYDAMETKPVAGDTITVYGIIGQYNGTAQMKNAWVTEIAAGVESTLFLGNNEFAVSRSNPEDARVYVAEQTGTLHITIRTLSDGNVNYGAEMDPEWAIITINGETYTSANETVEVTKGEVVEIALVSVDGFAYYADIYLSFEGFYEEPLGGELNPIVLTTEDVKTPEIPANGELYFMLGDDFTYDHALYVFGEDAYIVYEHWDGTEIYVYAENGVASVSASLVYEFRIGNAGDTAAAFDLLAEIPVGSESNPDTLDMGENVAEMSADMWAYCYTWIAEEAGTLTVTISGDSFWGFMIQNLDTSESYYLFEDGGVNTASVLVNAGDEVILQLNLTDPTTYESIDGTLTVTAAFTEGAVEDPTLGTEENPIEVTFEMNPAYTAGTATVTVPAGETVYYYAYGVGGMILTVTDAEGNVISSETLEGNPRMPVNFALTNDTESEATYTLTVSVPAGTMNNPAVLELGYNTVEVGTNGYFFTWTAEEETLFALSMMSDNWTYSMMIAHADGTYTYGDIRYSTDEIPVHATVIKLAAGDIITLNLGTADWTEATIDFSAVTYAGTESDPVVLNFIWNGMGTAASLNADLPAGEYVYALPVYGEGTLQLYVNGVQTEYTADPMGWDPSVVTINNETGMNAVYTLELQGPSGTQANPDELELGYVESEMIYADYQLSHWYSFTAEEDTLLVLSMMSDDWYYWGMYIDAATGYPTAMLEGHATDSDVLVPVQVVKLAAGETIWLCFGTINGAETVEFTAMTYAGTESDPVILDFTWNGMGTAASLNADLPAGEYVYALPVYGEGTLQLYVNGEQTEYTADPMGWDPSVVTINNETEMNAVYALELKGPAGTQANPDELELGYVESEMIYADYQLSHWYSFTAEEDTLLVLSMMSDDWYYWGMYIDAATGYPTAMLEGHGTDGDVLVPVQVVKLAAGETIWLCFGTINGAETVEFTAMTYAGTESDPVILDFTWNEEGTAASLNVDLPAGEYVYGAYIAGTILTVNGVETEYTAGGWRTPCTFTINNTAETNAVFALGLSYPAGSMFNPELIEDEGEFTAEIEEGTEGYFFNWIAPETGTLTVVVSADGGWYFVINNITAGLYGDPHWSDDAPVLTTETIQVNAGDMIEIIVNTYNPEDYSRPAGEITIELSFEPAVVDHECEPGEVVIENEVPGTCAAPGSYDEVTYCTICGEEVSRETIYTDIAEHTNVVHVEAVEPGCHMEGNIEYWYCTECQMVWQDEALTQITNRKNVVLPAIGGDVVHVEAVAPGCHFEGNIEYWYCAECEQVWQDEALTQITNRKNVILPATGGEVIHVEAKAPTCDENGNIEYWYCEECEQVWQDEARTQLTNRMNVILPATGHDFVDGVCTVCGEKVTLMGDVNGDGKVDTTDAKLIMQYDLGIIDETGLDVSAADVNGDGLIDTTDAKLIMQLDLGIITEFPKED